MKKLFIYLKNYKKECILGPLFKMLEASFELIVPFVMAAIIDRGIANADKPFIWKMGGVLLLFGFIGLVCSLTAQYFAAKAAVGFAANVKHALFAKIQSFSFSELDTIGTSTMINRMTTDINQVQTGVNLTIRLFLRSPFIVFGAMAMAFVIDAEAALTFVVAIPLLSLVVFGIMLITIPLYKKVQANVDRLLKATRQNLSGVRVIRAFNKQDDEIKKFDEINSSLTHIQNFVGKISSLMNPVTYIIVNAALIVLIWTGAVRVENGIITQGEVVALVNLMLQILTELIKMANLIITITKSIASGNRIAAVLLTESTLINGSAKEKGDNEYAVVFDHVSLKYKTASEESVTDISIKVRPGETIGIIGGTGSGKSTLVGMIPRFYESTDGSVKVFGRDVSEYDLDTLRGFVGNVMQKAILFKGTIRDNIKWGKTDATDEEIIEALKTAQAYEFVVKKEKQLDEMLTQGGSNLSGGQKQRLSIARALIGKPEILILDDSASALDFATEAKLRKAIAALDYKPTVFIVSQRASSIMHADRIIVLEDGKAEGIGTHAELLQTCDIYKEIYYSQFEKEAN